MKTTPEIKIDNPLYVLLQKGHINEFNERKMRGESSDLKNCDFRNMDLRGMDADGLDLSGGYFRQTDLRGIDLTNANLEGASIHAAKISGVYFPKQLSADEISLSFTYGTRMRYKSGEY